MMKNRNALAAFQIAVDAFEKMKQEIEEESPLGALYAYNKQLLLNSLKYIEGWYPSREEEGE